MTVSTETTEQPGSTIEVAGIATNFHEAGSGDPVLLLHGSGPGVSAWANWQHTIPVLAERHRVLAPDLVGFGYTERPTDIRYSAQTWIDHVWGFLDAMKIERTSIVGNSLGFSRFGHGHQAPRTFESDGAAGYSKPWNDPQRGPSRTAHIRAFVEGHGGTAHQVFRRRSDHHHPELVQLRHEASIAPGHSRRTARWRSTPRPGPAS